VIAAQAELERLRPLQLNAPLPDITRSLTLLRAQMEPSLR
jgi:uroporphyrin-3 C-methyltransferase